MGELKLRTPSLTNHSYDGNLSTQSELRENHAVGAAEGKTYDEHHERNHNSESGQTKNFPGSLLELDVKTSSLPKEQEGVSTKVVTCFDLHLIGQIGGTSFLDQSNSAVL